MFLLFRRPKKGKTGRKKREKPAGLNEYGKNC